MKLNTLFTILVMFVAPNSYAAEMPELARKLNCISCHDMDKLIVGPSWNSIAKKYKDAKRFTYDGKDYPLVEGLMMKVSRGGIGNWSTSPYPMPANDVPGTKQVEIRKLVEFILSLNK